MRNFEGVRWKRSWLARNWIFHKTSTGIVSVTDISTHFPDSPPSSSPSTCVGYNSINLYYSSLPHTPLNHAALFTPKTNVRPNSTRNISPFIVNSTCRLAGTGDSLHKSITIFISPPIITLYRHCNRNRRQERQKQIDARERQSRINSITLRRENPFPRDSNTVSKSHISSSNGESHALDDDKEEYIVDPVEGEYNDIKREGSKPSAENDACWEGCYCPCSLNKQLI